MRLLPLPDLPSSLTVRCICIFALLACIRTARRWALRRHAIYPPGPAGLPFIGNTLGVLKEKPYKVFARWGEQYGHIVSTTIYGSRIIVIDGSDVAEDLLNKRAAAFSDRPFRVPTHPHRAEYDAALAFMSQGEPMRVTRRQMHDALNARAVPREHPHLESATRKFLHDVLHNPSGLHGHIHMLYTSTILEFTLGYHVRSEDDVVYALSEKVGHNAMSMMTPSPKFWFELFPFFQHLPIWAAGRRAARTLYQFRDELRTLLALSEDHVRKTLGQPDAPPSFLSKLLHDKGEISESEKKTALFSSVSLYGGAVDTTISLTTSFFLAMMLHPEAQAKAHAEIDRVVGRQRLPTIADRAALPYTEALIMELMRWAPPIPLTSRPLSGDQVYDGYLLPKGSTVIANIWAMTHDPERYPSPDDFRPERFFDDTRSDSMTMGDAEPGALLRLESARKELRRAVFGFGRRVCPGRFYADAWLWITLSSTLAVTEITSPSTDVPHVEVEDGAILQLKPFPCSVSPRFDGAAELVAKDVEVEGC
ncbi:cytochrome P450 [Punctularia strigosozonata HHB-11173 SS5]|uniref:cytochrome P450 n=1 Tax=Punctularia strigosozonata (strain HHB-11173) TaxID=741275 RepID=UPI0004418273|nr:cytochrome P450 [Punctularia strigosozonata HHB-11173 SS5]EIN09172.1 cytochrome P450 [Punctularia strigosozonata HHB-11173 SS5]